MTLMALVKPGVWNGRPSPKEVAHPISWVPDLDVQLAIVQAKVALCVQVLIASGIVSVCLFLLHRSPPRSPD